MAYKLELPPMAAIHPVFHISQLRAAIGVDLPAQDILVVLTETIEWDVTLAGVRNVRPASNGVGVEVLIEWEGYQLGKPLGNHLS